MDDLQNMFFPGGRLFGIEWNTWKIVGWMANAAFATRFIIQWRATELRKQVVVPVIFWWLSIVGSLFLLSYAIFYRRDSVFIFANAFNWIPYIRNLVIHQRHVKAHVECRICQKVNPPGARFCMECGNGLPLVVRD